MTTFPFDRRRSDVDAVDAVVVASKHDAAAAAAVAVVVIAKADGDWWKHGGTDVDGRQHVAAVVQVQDIKKSFNWKK